jgi:uncharacterized protein
LSNPPKAPPTREEFGLPERTVIPADQLKTAQAMIRKQIDHWNVPIDELDPAAKIAVQERFVEALALIETGYRAQVIAELEGYLRDGRASGLASASFLGGYDNAIKDIKVMGGANLEKISGNLLGFEDNFLELLDRERQYRGKQEEWRSYQTWLETRNEKRSALERQWGYDTKHGMHLVRLLRMGMEILEGKGVIVKRPDAEELVAIRNGLWKYEDLLAWAEKQETYLDELYVTSPLPKGPPVAKLDDLLSRVVELSLSSLK